MSARERAERAGRRGSGVGLADFVNAAYLDRLAVAPHVLWDDRRRFGARWGAGYGLL